MLRTILIVTFVFGVALSAPSSNTPQDKIDRSLLTKLRNGQRANVDIRFVQSTQPVLEEVGSMQFPTRGERITYMRKQLEELAATSQKNALALLRAKISNAEDVHSFWISNSIIAKGVSLESVEEIAALPEVSQIREEIVVQIHQASILSSGNEGRANSQEDINATSDAESVKHGVIIVGSVLFVSLTLLGIAFFLM